MPADEPRGACNPPYLQTEPWLSQLQIRPQLHIPLDETGAASVSLMATSQQQDALEKAKERLKSNYSKARSARHGAQLCQPRGSTALGSVRRPGARPAPAPRPGAAPPRQLDLTGEAPTLSPALKAQGWAVK